MGRTGSPSSSDVPQDHEYGKTEYSAAAGDHVISPVSDGTELHRGLKSRHITMIAIGGAIGTGLIIGSGAALARAGFVFHIQPSMVL